MDCPEHPHVSGRPCPTYCYLSRVYYYLQVFRLKFFRYLSYSQRISVYVFKILQVSFVFTKDTCVRIFRPHCSYLSDNLNSTNSDKTKLRISSYKFIPQLPVPPLTSRYSPAPCRHSSVCLRVMKYTVVPPDFRFPVVSLEFFLGTILPAALWPWGRLSP